MEHSAQMAALRNVGKAIPGICWHYFRCTQGQDMQTVHWDWHHAVTKESSIKADNENSLYGTGNPF